jgi:hypothetical protein
MAPRCGTLGRFKQHQDLMGMSSFEQWDKCFHTAGFASNPRDNPNARA